MGPHAKSGIFVVRGCAARLVLPCLKNPAEKEQVGSGLPPRPARQVGQEVAHPCISSVPPAPQYSGLGNNCREPHFAGNSRNQSLVLTASPVTWLLLRCLSFGHKRHRGMMTPCLPQNSPCHRWRGKLPRSLSFTRRLFPNSE